MAALTSADWTLAEISYVASTNTFSHEITNSGKRVKRFSMTLATVGTYPTGGIPIPTTAASWGMKRNFERIQIYDSAQADGNVVKYSATGQVIRLYQNPASASDTGTAQGVLLEIATTATAGTGGTMILYVEAYGV